MGKRNRSEVLAQNLPQLQNLIRRDPQSYKEEFLTQWRHWESGLAIFQYNPQEERQEFAELITFLSHVSYCYPKETANFPQQLVDILQNHHLVLAASIRRAMVQALVLLRNKDLIPTTSVLALFFTLFRVHDKELRKMLHNFIVTDIKNSNAKAKNNKLNKTLQNYMYTMLQDSNDIAARKSLDVMIDLYHRNIWNDGKTVNVIAEACLTTRPKIVSTAVHFFLGTNEPNKDDDDDDDIPDLNALKHRMQINKKKNSKNSMLEKAKSAIKKKEAKKSRAEVFNFSALHLLNDPQNFAEKLMARLKNSTSTTSFRFELRLDMMNLISRLIGIHKLLLIPFYDFCIPYLKPQQRDVTKILAYIAQASHDLVPPDVISPLVQTIADNFIWSNAATEVVTAGLNSIREICSRCPLAMSESLLQSLVEDYKTNKDKSAMMAGRSLLGLFREVNPEMLRKKDRGKVASVNKTLFQAPKYGEVKVMDMIDGVDLLLKADDEEEEEEEEEFGSGEEEEDGESPRKKKKVSHDEDPGDGWEGWEVASLDSEDEEPSKKKKKSKSAKVEVLEVEGEEEVGSDVDEGEWEDEDEEGEEEGEEGAGEGWEGWEEASLDSEDAEDDDDHNEEEDDDEEAPEMVDEEDEEDDSVSKTSSTPGKQIVGPKQAKLKAQRERREKEGKVEQSEDLKKKLIEVASERIFTDEDFAKMRELAANRRAEQLSGIKRSRVEELLDEEDSDEDATAKDIVDVRRITSGVKRKMTYDERMAHIQEGREGREKFGSKMGQKKAEHGGSTTNKEKAKKTKAFMMIVHKRSVQGKAKMSLRDKQKVLRNHIKKQKKKGH
ncbi:Protein SDA1 [Chytridiales sp. JEL 0842]|nr:Protein SDA1 [Chytridiales sp. JEL 0842]